MVPSITVAARAASTDASNPMHADSSFFTFLIALLILVFASGALVFRAILIRRRFRRRFQAALEAGIFPAEPIAQEKPELYEVCVRSASHASDWHSLMPICVTKVMNASINTKSSGKGAAAFPTQRPTMATRLRGLLGHRPTPSATVTPESDFHDPKVVEPSTVQVTVLIAMPSEYTTIPPFETETVDTAASPRGKRKDSALGDTEDVLPDVMFGISSLEMAHTPPASKDA